MHLTDWFAFWDVYSCATNLGKFTGWKKFDAFLLKSGLEVQKLSNLQWVAGNAVYYVQRIREGALPSEKLHLEKVTYQESILSPKVTNLVTI